MQTPLAADSLAQGKPIPQTAQELLGKQIIPNWMYTLFGGYGWKQQAKHYGLQKELNRQLYL